MAAGVVLGLGHRCRLEVEVRQQKPCFADDFIVVTESLIDLSTNSTHFQIAQLNYHETLTAS